MADAAFSFVGSDCCFSPFILFKDIMSSSREKCFKSKVIQNLYQNDESSDEEANETKSSESTEKVVLTKRKSTSQNTTDIDWPVVLPKLKKVYTVNVKPEDLQKAASSSASSTSGQKEESVAEREKRIAKNRKRKLKKKRQKQKGQLNSSSSSAPSCEFTY